MFVIYDMQTWDEEFVGSDPVSDLNESQRNKGETRYSAFLFLLALPPEPAY